LKPAETTPLSAIRLFELIEKVEFPPGSAQLVLGPGPTVGQTLAESMLVDKIAFTGGTATGRKIMQAATSNIKKVTLELGGKSPNIVFADADLDVALEFAMFGIYAGQGEVCSGVRGCSWKERSPTNSSRVWQRRATRSLSATA
jgi:betaine-aldehyde dehydrogenase